MLVFKWATQGVDTTDHIATVDLFYRSKMEIERKLAYEQALQQV